MTDKNNRCHPDPEHFAALSINSVEVAVEMLFDYVPPIVLRTASLRFGLLGISRFTSYYLRLTFSSRRIMDNPPLPIDHPFWILIEYKLDLIQIQSYGQFRL